jgi:hypothetical protein
LPFKYFTEVLGKVDCGLNKLKIFRFGGIVGMKGSASVQSRKLNSPNLDFSILSVSGLCVAEKAPTWTLGPI